MDMNDIELKLRKDLCEVSRRLYMAGFMVGSDGNVSTILSDNEILITPSRLCKGFMEPEQMVKIDRQGRQLSGDLPPTSETAMHLAAYEERPDICSVVHCHPPILVAFTVAGMSLPESILPEIEVIFGGPLPLAPYATPGGSDIANSLRPLIRDRSTSAVLLDHHGILGVGNDVYQASMKIEHAEAAAKVIFYARQLGGERPLPPNSMEKLREVRKRIVEMESQVFSAYCHAPECKLQRQPEEGVSDQEIEQVVRKVVADLKRERM
jgi:L-fuculose-phosphate aldolase